MQREDVLGEALKLLELQGIANTTLEMVAERVDYPLDELRRFWPDKEAILYDALRYLSQQIDVWRRQLMLDETQTAEQKLLARYQALSECVKNNRYPGCLFIAACTFYPDPGHPIHQLADQQKSAAYDFTHELLTTLEVDDPAMVANRFFSVFLSGQCTTLAAAGEAQDIFRQPMCSVDIRLATIHQHSA